MRKRIAVLLAASALGVGAVTPVALAVDDGDDITEEDDGFDYGLLGLLGLAGLAGLLGRNRDDRHRHDRTSTTSSSGTRSP